MGFNSGLKGLMIFGFSLQMFEKYSNIIFQENPSSGNRVVPCGRTDGQIDMMKPIDAFCNFANASKNRS